MKKVKIARPYHGNASAGVRRILPDSSASARVREGVRMVLDEGAAAENASDGQIVSPGVACFAEVTATAL
jgi:hypothetical protein